MPKLNKNILITGGVIAALLLFITAVLPMIVRAKGVAAIEEATGRKATYRKEKFPKPRNAIGLVKDLPDNEMKKLIIANTEVGENELRSLARERTAAVMSYMITRGGLPPERLFQKNDDIYKVAEKGTVSRSRVEFNAIAR